MATLSELVKVIATVQGLDENQVLWIARYLREDGLISQGGRGRGGAKMAAKDAANLLIGVNAPGVAKEAAHLVRAFRSLPLTVDHLAPDDIDEWDGLRSENDDTWTKAFYRLAPFGAALEQIIEQFRGASDEDGRDIARVTLAGPMLTASVYMGAAEAERAGDVSISVVFGDIFNKNAKSDIPDQEISKTFTGRTLAQVGRVLDI